MGIVDMHCHLLYGVDDGAKTIDESIEMLQIAADQGITDIILTPHYRHGMFAYPTDLVRENYNKLVPHAEGLGINLYLGCEYHVNSRILEYLESGRCLTLAEGEYVLAEYSYDTPFSYIKETVHQLLNHGYIPVVAHVERYGCFIKEPFLAEELSDLGALIQVDANAVLGMEGRPGKKCCRTLLKNDLVDLVGSDSHDTKDRANHMQECYRYVSRKFGESMAQRIFDITPHKIIDKR